MRVATTVVVVGLGGSAGGVQSAEHSRTAVIALDESATPADGSVHVRITGL